jgi:hypothetical protein
MRIADEQSSAAVEPASGTTSGRAVAAAAVADGTEAALEPNGGIAAALLAAAFGCAVFGVLVVLAEVSASIKETLTVSQGAGPLSGKGIGATIAWAAAWAGLHAILRGREVPWRPVARATTAMVTAGLVLTFPPVFQHFAAH